MNLWRLSKPEDEPDPLLSEQVFQGTWWLPEEPHRTVAGTVRFRPFQSIVLELSGVLGAAETPWDMVEADVVLGEIHGGPKVTLFDVFETRRGPQWPGRPLSELCANLMLVGAHYSSSDEGLFSAVEVHYTELEAWSGHHALEVDSSGKEPPWCIGYRPPPDVEIEIAPVGCSLRLLSSCKLSAGRRSAGLLHRSFFRVQPDEPRPRAWVREVVNGLQNLLILLQGRYVPIAELRADGVSFFMVQDGKHDDRPVSPDDMLISYPQIREDFPGILPAWFEQTEALRPVHDLLFSSYYRPGQYPEVHFLTFTQALECYHRRRHEGLYLSEAEYDRVRRALVDAMPKGVPLAVRDSLADKLKYGNEYSQRKRFKDLLDVLDRESQELITAGDAAFVDKVLDLRNCLTHWTVELQKNVEKDFGGRRPGGIDYIRLNWRLRAWLSLHLLHDLGIAVEDIAKAMRNHTLWKHWLIQETL